MPLTRLALPARAGEPTAWLAVEPFDELVASWAVPAEEGVEARVQVGLGDRRSAWFVLARREQGAWHSVPGQGDALAEVDVDVVRARAGAGLDGCRLCVHGAGASALAISTSQGAPGAPPSATAAGPVEIPLEPLSQLAYADVAPELDGGGRSWCAPTSLAMVLRRWDVDLAVPDVARAVHDPAYGGCGNWSVAAWFAASLGLDAVVTRLGGLAAARPLLAAGVPLVVSIVAGPGALPGFPLAGGTRGHLLVLAGETAGGDPIVLDPAAPEPATVRRVYPRAAFERAWVGGSRGTAIVVRPHDHAVPRSPDW